MCVERLSSVHVNMHTEKQVQPFFSGCKAYQGVECAEQGDAQGKLRMSHNFKATAGKEDHYFWQKRDPSIFCVASSVFGFALACMA